MTIVLPEPLGDARDYIAEIKRLDAAIAAAEKELSKLRRERGCRILQLRELEGPLPTPQPASWSERAQRKLKRLLSGG